MPSKTSNVKNLLKESDDTNNLHRGKVSYIAMTVNFAKAAVQCRPC